MRSAKASEAKKAGEPKRERQRPKDHEFGERAVRAADEGVTVRLLPEKDLRSAATAAEKQAAMAGQKADPTAARTKP